MTDQRDTSHAEFSVSMLPSELLRRIGDELDSPAELLQFARTCGQIGSAFGAFEFGKKDAEYQLKLRFDPGLDSSNWHFRKPMTIGLKYSMILPNAEPTTKPAKYRVYRPGLLQAIENGEDIAFVRQYIKAYLKYFPAGLEGQWYPAITSSFARLVIHEYLPSPVFAAAKSGRLDVLQALLDCGVSIRGRDERRRRISLWSWNFAEDDDYFSDDDEYYYLQFPYEPDNASCNDPPAEDEDSNHYSINEAAIRADNAFSAACESNQEDLALFMIGNGLDVRASDLWHAVKFADFQVIEALLRHPVFNTNARERIVVRVLNWAVENPVKDFSVIERLLRETPADEEWRHSYFFQSIEYAINWNPWEKLIPQTVYLLNLYADWANTPLNGASWASSALYKPNGLEVIKTLFNTDSWFLGQNESEHLREMEHILSGTAWNGEVDIARYLLTLGYRFSAVHLETAIKQKKTDMVVEILASGVSASSIIDPFRRISSMHNYPVQSPLKYVLFWLRFDRRDHLDTNRDKYRIVYRLLYHGADVLDLDDIHRDRLYYSVIRTHRTYQSLRAYHSQRITGAQEVKPSRLSFQEKVPEIVAKEPIKPMEMEQIHAMLSIILGENYMEELFISHLH
ncbi:hypothetical protein GGR54DRAFT_635653 [Hypoxylon sp. NC1633]|nr:hypothetical protein GGR54DRAFT_635653 [Hypoxylon sp. NC1633]